MQALLHNIIVIFVKYCTQYNFFSTVKFDDVMGFNLYYYLIWSKQIYLSNSEHHMYKYVVRKEVERESEWLVMVG